MNDYLLDTNMVNFWYNPALPEHNEVSARVAALPSATPIHVSIFTIAEIRFGHRIAAKPDWTKQAALEQFLGARFPMPLAPGVHTCEHYADLRSRLFRKYPPKGKRKRRPEQCFDPITASELGMDENDLWIAAQAVEHNLVLVTHDKLRRITDVAAGLLEVEDWAVPR